MVYSQKDEICREAANVSGETDAISKQFDGKYGKSCADRGYTVNEGTVTTGWAKGWSYWTPTRKTGHVD